MLFTAPDPIQPAQLPDKWRKHYQQTHLEEDPTHPVFNGRGRVRSRAKEL